jgi:hypothetical protein
VAESHTTYPVLVRFRSPGPLSSWVTALLAVLDSAALFLALSPEAAPVVLRISEIPRCRSLEFPRGRAVRRAWD